jgi:hypothetical protein
MGHMLKTCVSSPRQLMKTIQATNWNKILRLQCFLHILEAQAFWLLQHLSASLIKRTQTIQDSNANKLIGHISFIPSLVTIQVVHDPPIFVHIFYTNIVILIPV